MPVRRVNRFLRRIRYYSATRRHTVWSRALDAWLLIAVLLAVPATFAAERLVGRAAATTTITGAIYQSEDGEYHAHLLKESQRYGWTDGDPYGEFTLALTDFRRGWPVVSSIGSPRPTLTLNPFTVAGTIDASDLPEDDPRRLAIRRALRADRVLRDPAHSPHQRLLDVWNAGDDGTHRRYWIGTAFGTALWWLMLSVVGYVAIGLTRFAARVLRARREARIDRLLARGRCHHCGYDMRGLEFNARCPECGTLVR